MDIEKKRLGEFSDADNNPNSDFYPKRLLLSDLYYDLGSHQTRGVSVVTRFIDTTEILC